MQFFFSVCQICESKPLFCLEFWFLCKTLYTKMRMGKQEKKMGNVNIVNFSVSADIKIVIGNFLG